MPPPLLQKALVVRAGRETPRKEVGNSTALESYADSNGKPGKENTTQSLSLLPSQYFSCIKFGEPEVFPRTDYDLVPFCGVHSAAKAWLLSVCLRDLEWAGQAHFMPLH